MSELGNSRVPCEELGVGLPGRGWRGSTWARLEGGADHRPVLHLCGGSGSSEYDLNP